MAPRTLHNRAPEAGDYYFRRADGSYCSSLNAGDLQRAAQVEADDSRKAVTIHQKPWKKNPIPASVIKKAIKTLEDNPPPSLKPKKSK